MSVVRMGAAYLVLFTRIASRRAEPTVWVPSPTVENYGSAWSLARCFRALANADGMTNSAADAKGFSLKKDGRVSSDPTKPELSFLWKTRNPHVRQSL